MNAARKPRFYLAKSIASLLAGYFVLDLHTSFAQPRGQQVVSGQASFDLRGRDMTIRAGNNSIINYQSFNIGRGEKVQFVQPSSSSRVLNRVTDASPTQIFGMLQANGQIYLVNPAGIFFQNGSVINVGGLFAAAGHMADQDFLSGKNLFTQLSGDVVNRGVINSVGDVGLFGANVANFGTITSQTGVVAMLAGDQVLIGEKGSNIFVGTSPAAAPAANAKPGVQNAGTIQAPRAVLGAGDMYAMAIVNSGKIASPDITLQGGKNGQVAVSGTLDASVHAPGKVGGKIKVLGGKIALRAANLDASGSAGGGEILIGGDTHGGNGVQTASKTTVDAATIIKADALVSGTGGKVVVWSDVLTNFAGTISAKGAGTGAGGFAEVSGDTLAFTGHVDLSSPAQTFGTLLLDPHNIIIAAAGTPFVAGGSTFATTPAADQTIAASSLDQNANVVLQANTDVTVNSTISMNTSGVSLTIQAGRSILVNANITTTNGAIVMTANDPAATVVNRDAGAALFTMAGGTTISSQGADIALSIGTGVAGSTSGAMTLTNVNAGAGSVTATNIGPNKGTITSGSIIGANIGLTADTMTPGTLTATGTVTLTTASAAQPINLAAAGGLSLTNAQLGAITASQLTIGDATNTAGITVGGAVTLAQAKVPALFLHSSGPIAEGAAGTLSVSTLAVEGDTTTGTVNLNQANVVGTITGKSDGTAASSFVFFDAADLIVGSLVGPGLTGIATTDGAIQLSQSGGNHILHIAEPLSASSSGGGANGNVNVTFKTVDFDFNASAGPTPTISSTNQITFAGTPAMQLTADTTLNAVQADFGAGSTIDGASTWKLSLDFSSAVNPTVINGTTTTIFSVGNAATYTNLGSLETGNGGVTQLVGPTGTPIVTAQDQIYNDDVVLIGNTVLNARNVTFAQTLNSDQTGATSNTRTLTVTGTGTIAFDGPVGASGKELGTLTLNATAVGAAIDLNGSTVQTKSADQIYNGPVVLTADTTLTVLTSGNVTFNSTVDSQATKLWTLAVNAPGVTWFQGDVGTAVTGQLGALTTDGQAPGTAAGAEATWLGFGAATVHNAGSGLTGSTITINTQPDTTAHATTGEQTYNDDVVLKADTTINAQLNGAATPNVTFGRTVNSEATKLWTLAVNAPGVTWFKGDVGTAATGQLGSLTTDYQTGAAEVTRLGNGANTVKLPDATVGNTITVTTNGDQVYNDDVELGANTTLNGANVTFARTVNSDTTGWSGGTLWTLGVNSPGTTWFKGNVGTVAALGSLTTDYQTGAAEVTRLGNGVNTVQIPRNATVGNTITVTTNGDQVYNDDVELGANTTLNGANVTFARTVNSDTTGWSGGTLWTLGVNSPGTTWFKGNVGTVAALGSLTTDYQTGAAEATRLGNGVNTVQIPRNATVGNTITVTTNGDQVYNDDVELGANTTLNGANVTFARTVNSDTTGWSGGTLWTLEVNSPGTTWFKGNVGTVAALGSLTTDYQTGAAEVTRLGNGVNTVQIPRNATVGNTITVTTNGDQVYNDDVELGANTTLNGANVTFARTVNSDTTGWSGGTLWTLGVNSPGTTWFKGNVGTVAALGSLTTDYQTGAAEVTRLGNGVNTVQIPRNATVGNTITVTTNGDQVYNDDVELGANTTLNGANVTFARTVNSDTTGWSGGTLWTLGVNSPGTTWFKGNVGTVAALGSLTTDYQTGAAEATRLGNGVNTVQIPRNATVGNTITVTTNGDQVYNDDVELGANTTLNGANVTFARTVNSDTTGWSGGTLWTLGVNSPGTTWFKGNVGTVAALGSLTTDYQTGAAEATRLGNGVNTVQIPRNATVGNTITVTTNGDQVYNDDVELGANTTLNGANVTFARTVNSDTTGWSGGTLWTLGVNSPGTTWFKGNVGTVAALGSLTTDYQTGAAEATRLGNGVNTVQIPRNATVGNTITVTTNGDQVYNDDVELGANTTLNGANVTFARTVNSDTTGWSGGTLWTLGVNSPGTTWFKGNVGTVAALGSLTTDYQAGAAEVTLLGNGANTVQIPRDPTVGATITMDTKAGLAAGQTYGDDVVLKADTLVNAVSTGGVTQDVTFARTLKSDQTAGVSNLWTLVVNSAGTTKFGGAVGGLLSTDNVQLGALTTDAPGVTDINGGEVRTKVDLRAVHPVTGVAHMTTGDQTYNDDVVLTANTTLDAELNGGTYPNVTFARTVNSDTTLGVSNLWTLTVNAPGVTWFQGNVGTVAALGALTTDYQSVAGEATWLGNGANTVQAPGSAVVGSTITINTQTDDVVLSVRTGDQFYKDDVVLKADTTINALLKTGVLVPNVKPNVTFARTVKSDQTAGVSNLWTLVVNSAGTTKFGGAVGGLLTTDNVQLGSLMTDGPGVTDINGGEVRTKSDGSGGIRTGNQTYNDDVVLTANTTLDAESNGGKYPNVTFARTVNSDTTLGVSNLWTLTVNVPGITWFQGNVGTVAALGALTTDYQALAAGPTEVTRLGFGVNTVQAPGSAAVADTMTVTTSGDQTYNDDVEVGARTTLNGANVTFARTVNSDTTGWSGGTLWTLGVNSPGTTWFKGNVGTVAALGSLTTDYQAGAAEVTLLGNGANTVQIPRDPTVGATITMDTKAGLAAGQTYGDDVVLKADTLVNAVSTGGVTQDVTFARTLKSDQTAGVSNLWTLVVNSAGTTKFGGAVGGLLSTDNVQLGALTTDAPGVTDINGGEVRTKVDLRAVHPVTGVAHMTTGNQTYNDDVVLTANTQLDAELNGGTYPNVTFARTVNTDGTPWTLLVNAPGITWFQGNVGTVAALGALTTDYQALVAAPTEVTRLGNGVNTVQAPNSAAAADTMTVTTTGNQVYNDDGELGARTTLNGANVTFARTVNSDTTGWSGGTLWTLGVNSPGTTWFQGNVGTVAALGALRTDTPGATWLGFGANTVQIPRDPTVGNTMTITTQTDNVVASARTGDQSYGDDVGLKANTTVNALLNGVTVKPNVTFARTVNTDGTQWTLLVNAPGVTWFKGNVGTVAALGSLTTDYQALVAAPTEVTRLGNGVNTVQAPGSAAVGNTMTVTTTGDQLYQDDVEVGARTTLNGANVTFQRTVNSDLTNWSGNTLWTLTVNSPGITWFQGNVGTAVGTQSGVLGALTTDYQGGVAEVTRLGNGANTVQIPRDPTVLNTMTVTTAGDQLYKDDVELGARTTLNGANVTFARTVNSDLTNWSGNTLWTLTVNSPGITWFQGNVGTAMGTQSGVLGALTTDYQAGVAEVTRLGNGANTVQIPRDPTVLNTMTIDTQTDNVVASARTGNQSYGDDVVLKANTTINAQLNGVTVQPNVTFARTVNTDGTPWTLLVNAPGVTWFKGNVGTVAALGSLTTDYQALVAAPTEVTRLGNGVNTVQAPNSAVLGDTMTVTTTGDQLYQDDVEVGARTTLNGANVTFARTVNADLTNWSGKTLWTLAVNSPGITWFQGNVGTAMGTQSGVLGALTTDYQAGVAEVTRLGNGANTVQIPRDPTVGSTMTIDTQTDNVVASARTGNQSYGDDVVLKANTTINALLNGVTVQPNVTFARTVNTDGTPWTLLVNAPGVTWFKGNVGTVAALGSLTTDYEALVAAPTEVTRLGNGVNTVQAPNSAVLGDTMTVTTTGDQLYQDDVEIGARTSLNGANVTFQRTVNSDLTNWSGKTLWTLAVNSPGVTWFQGNVGTAVGTQSGVLGALTTDFQVDLPEVTLFGNEAATVQSPRNPALGATITVNTGAGGETHNDDVELWADGTLNSTGNITFNHLLDSHVAAGMVHNLNARAFNEIFNGVVGGRLILGNLVTDMSGTYSGAAQFNMTAPVVPNVAGVNAYSVTTYDNFVDFNVKNSTYLPPQINASVQTTVGGQTYYSQATLQQNTVLIDTASKDILFSNPNLSGAAPKQTLLAVDASIEGMQSLEVHTGGTVQFNGAIGAITRLGNLTTAAGSTEFNVPTQTFAVLPPVMLPQLVFPNFANPLWHPGWVNVTGNVTVAGPVKFNVLNSNSINPTVDSIAGNQSYLGAATLAQETYVHSGVIGSIKFDSTVIGPHALTITAGGLAMLNGNVTISSLDVTGSQGIQLAAYAPITIFTGGPQSYDNDVALLHTVTSTSSGFPIMFKGRTDGPGGLTVMTPRSTVTFTGAVGSSKPVDFLQVNANIIRVADVAAENDATLDAADLLFLNGSTYTAGGTLAFNPTARSNISGSSSIVKATGNLSLSASTFKMGLQQKLLVDAGSLTITAGSASLADMAAARFMNLNIGSITILGRPAGGFVDANRRDEGVSFVSPTITVNGSINGIAPGGKVNFGTLSGIVDGGNNVFSVPGVSVLKQTDLANQFDHAGNELGTFLQPIAGGLVTTLNSSVNPVVPVVFELPQPFLFETESPISLNLINDLINLGINAREATIEERLSINIREGVFNQPQDYVEPEDSGYEVVVNRVTTGEVKRVTKRFKQINLASIQQILDNAVTKYFSDTKAEDVNGDKFLSWIEQKSGSEPEAQQGLAALQKLAGLYNEIEQMGLTDAEVSRSEKTIAAKVNLQGPLNGDELKNAIKKLQSTTPKKPLEVSTKKGPNQASREGAGTPPKHGSS